MASWPCGGSAVLDDFATTLADAEKYDLKRDGFLVLRNAVARSVGERAKALINQDPTRIVHGDSPATNGHSVLRDDIAA